MRVRGRPGSAWGAACAAAVSSRERRRGDGRRGSAGAFFVGVLTPSLSTLSPSQEMCAQMYYRGKMFGFVHLYSGQEAVSTGVIR